MNTRALWIVLVLWLFTIPLSAQEEVYISAIAYSKDGDHLALGYSDGGLKVFSVEETILGDRLFTELGELGMSSVDSLEWHPFNNDVLLVSELREAYVLNLKLPTSAMQGGVLASRVVWSADGTQIFANYAPDGIFYQTDILDYPSFETSEIEYSGPISTIKFNPLRTQSVFSKFGNFPGTYVQNNNEEILYTFTFPEAIYDLQSASYADWGNEVIALGDSNYLGIYDENSYAPLWIETSDTDALSFFGIAIRPHMTQIALLNKRQIRLFDWISQRDVAIIPIPQGYPDMDWSPDGRYLAYVSDGELYIEEMPFGDAPALTITPILIEGLTPVVLPTQSATQTLTATATP